MIAIRLAALSCIAILAQVPGRAEETMTPLILNVADAPVPFTGSDGHIHLVYELGMTNFSSGDIAVEKVEVLSNGAAIETLDTALVGCAPASRRAARGRGFAGQKRACAAVYASRVSRRNRHTNAAFLIA